MKISAKVAQGDGEFDLSGLGVLAHAFGVLTGAMNTGATFIGLGNNDLTLVIAQMLMLDGGDKRLVAGSSPSRDDRSTFLAMADGKIERLILVVNEGEFVAESHNAAEEELSECVAYDLVNEAMALIASERLKGHGLVSPGAEIRGVVDADLHEAIRNFMTGEVSIILKEEGHKDKGYVVNFNHITSRKTMEEATQLTSVDEMTDNEMLLEQRHRADASVVANPFGAPAGIA